MVAFSKSKKYKKTKKTRGGNNIGSNCNDPNFSIYNTNMLKLFPYKGGKTRNSKKTRKVKKIKKTTKGGKLYLDDPYKNSEGPQY